VIDIAIILSLLKLIFAIMKLIRFNVVERIDIVRGLEASPFDPQRNIYIIFFDYLGYAQRPPAVIITSKIGPN